MTKEYEDFIHVHCNRDYKGMVDIRSHIVEMAINKDKPIHVTCDTLPGVSGYSPKQLKNDKVRISKKEFKSKYDDSSYKLISYNWKATK